MAILLINKNRNKLPNMSKHINTHLFFHMNDSSSSKQKNDSSTSTTTTKPKKPSTLISGYEIDTNPPLPSESGDYYDYYTNYGIPDYYGPTTPPISPPYAHYHNDYPYYIYDRNAEYNNDYYHQGDGSNYRESYDDGPNTYPRSYNAYSGANNNLDQARGVGGPSSSAAAAAAASSSSYYSEHPSSNNLGYLQAPMISPPVYDPKRTFSSSPSTAAAAAAAGGGDAWSYRNDHRGLSAFAHKLHRITFVEACIFQPPDLPSPVRATGGGHHSSSSAGGSGSGPPPPIPLPMHQPRPTGPPVLAQGERSPTTTGGTQYYQEWASKHMRHLCSRFEKPEQQQLLMNVERKSKYPFIILCTPDQSSSLSKSSSCSSAKMIPNRNRYNREISHNSAYSLEEEDEDEEEEEHWITQKQRDSVNSHYLPPPPPPLLMPHIWPEIRYIDGLYTVCASIVRPGSGVPCEFDEYLYSDINSTFDQTGYGDSYQNHHHRHQQEKHITFQDNRHQQQSSSSQEQSNKSIPVTNRPAGYIVSAFATFPGEDSDRLEKNWLFWTGARILYKYLPNCVGLRRLIFLKRCPDMYREDLITQQSKTKPTIFTGFTYVLLCECFNLKESYIASVCTTIDQLRARCCGYSALYLTHFQQSSRQHQHPSSSHHLHQHRPGATVAGASTVSNTIHHGPLMHHQTPPHHHHHSIPRHHRSTSDFNEFDGQ